jgi:hypothetical protein
MGVMETRAYRSNYLLGKGWTVSHMVGIALISVWYTLKQTVN